MKGIFFNILLKIQWDLTLSVQLIRDTINYFHKTGNMALLQTGMTHINNPYRLAKPQWLQSLWSGDYALKILVNIGSGNGLLPDSTKPLPELIVIYHKRGHLVLTPG